MKKKTVKKARLLFLFISQIVLFIGILSFMEANIMPSLKEISHLQCKAYMNHVIDSAVKEMISDSAFHPDDFLQEVDENRLITDTALINHFCSAFSSRINEKILDIPCENIKIPLGAAFDLDFLADIGPVITFTLYPMGSVHVDYETSFISAGINQINYRIWLNISMEAKIVNPLYDEELQLNRKILLVDMILNGKVPQQYFQMTAPDEYLLTE